MPSGTRLGSMYWEIGADRTGLDNALAQSEQAVQRFGSQASGSFNALTVAAGNLLANGISAVAGGLKNLVGDAFNVTAEYERMTLSMESLAKRDLMNAAETEKTIVTGQKFVEGKAAELDKIAALQIAYDGYAISLDKARYHLAEISKTQGPGDIDFREYANDVANYEQKLADTKKKMDDLGGESGKLVDVTKKVTEQHLSNAQATLRSRDAAQELLTWVHKLAVESPFDEEGAKAALQTAMTYGFMTDQAKALAIEVGKITEKEAEGVVTAQQFAETAIDFAAATGQSSAVMDQIARAMGQMKQAGKVTGQDIMQLTNAGVDAMGYISKAMGISKAEAMELRTKGLLPADAAIKAIVEGLQKDFGGAAKRQTETWSGLISTLGETKKLGMRVFFESTFKALKPLTVGIVNTIADPKFIEGLKATGELLGKKVEWGVEHVRGLLDLPGVIKELAALPDGFKNMAELDAIFGKMPEDMRNLAYAGRDLVKAFQDEGLAGAVDVIKGWAGDAWNKIKDWWDTDGDKWATDTAKKISDWLLAVPGKLTDLAIGAGQWLAGVWKTIGDWWTTDGAPFATELGGRISTWWSGTFLPALGAIDWASIGAAMQAAWDTLSTWWTTEAVPFATQVATNISTWFTGQVIPALQTQAPLWGEKLAEVLKSVITINGQMISEDASLAYTLGAGLMDLFIKGTEAALKVFAIGPMVLSWIVKQIASVFTGKDVAKAEKDAVSTAIKDFFGGAFDAMYTKLAPDILNIGSQIVNSLKEGITKAATDFKDWIVNWARSVIPKSLWAFFGIDDGSPAGGGGSGSGGGGGGANSNTRGMDANSGGRGMMAAGGGIPAIYVTVYAGGGGPEVVRRAANEGTMEALRARGYR